MSYNFFHRRKKDEKQTQIIPSAFRYYQTIFIHVPKCAGSSISLHLFGYQVGHLPIKKYYAIDPVFAGSAFKFTFVRHPVLRFISAFEFLKNGGLNESDASFSRQHHSLFESIDSFAEELVVNTVLQAKHHFKPQYSFLTANGKDHSGQMFVDFVGKTESLKSDCERLKKVLPATLHDGLDSAMNYPLNSSKKQMEFEKIDPATFERVNKFYEIDTWWFGYDRWKNPSALTHLLNELK